MKCVVCGRNEAVEHGMCSSCIYDNTNVENIGPVSLVFCPKCGSIRIGKKWYRDSYGNKLLPMLLDEVKCSDVNARISGDEKGIFFDEKNKQIILPVTIKRSNMKDKIQNVAIPYSVTYISCPTCNKITGSYFEATIQLRTVSTKYDNILESVLESIEAIVEKRKKEDAESFISKVEKKPEGIDIYLGKRTDGDVVSSFVLDHFFSSIIVTKTLAGVKDGKKFFRFTYSLRILDAKEGSLLSVNRKKYILTAIRNRHIDVIDVETEDKTRINRNTFFVNDGKIVTKEPQMRKFIVVSRQGNESLLMDAQTFKMITVKGTPESDEVYLFTYKGKYFM
ncbi:hypothetical protein [Thermoplasma volcanium GSS1]|uniref:Nmd3 N-terminal domain-containing protein n=1 Tax=Thermoplasma volcanium (strain ATCC 51530 / DSM 4299 / JCM 9571 / NBRC 15438 / GSS1) TaxID=273116 RepID=Q97BH8_THEVO|nr:60S ribosomal export protein NMD3 [Thermoplasma volcanium]BAB59619.1 hypothetical protein [Thermoplasma volcanium GSS1]